MLKTSLATLLLAMPLALPLSAFAQAPAPVASESRDAAAAFIATQDLVVRRIGEECFETIGKTPEEFSLAWQKRNEKYHAATVAYLYLRLVEAERVGGMESADGVKAAFNKAVQTQGKATLADVLQSGEHGAVCKKWGKLIEDGKYDIGPDVKMYAELQALVSFLDKNYPPR